MVQVPFVGVMLQPRQPRSADSRPPVDYGSSAQRDAALTGVRSASTGEQLKESGSVK